MAMNNISVSEIELVAPSSTGRHNYPTYSDTPSFNYAVSLLLYSFE